MLGKVFELINVPYGALETPLESPSDKQSNFLNQRVLEVPRFDKTIFCLPGSEIFRYVAFYPRQFFGSQKLIAMMPWELPEWPIELVPVLQLFDEIWSITEFIKTTLEKVAPCPVHLVRRYIEELPAGVFDRSHFGIAPDAYVFLFIFDSLSSLSRKNPLGLIKAFHNAFQNSGTSVQLVLKTMKSSYDKASSELREQISRAENIVLIDRTLSNNEISSLIRVADSYVSLHRAEGFGLTIADAMLAEKPVVVSNYSGNLDFCKSDTAYLVDGDVVELGEGQYFYTDRQTWFEPNLDDAAQKMRACFVNKNQESAEIARNGQAVVRNLYGLESSARSLRERLKDLR